MTRPTPRRRFGGRRKTLVRASWVTILAVSLLLTGVNVYGVVTGGIDREQTPLWPGRTDSRLLTGSLDRRVGESGAAYLDRLAFSIHRRMAVYWKLHDEVVPLKENWLLNIMQYPFAVYRDYQYYDASRALRRGVGQCGQFALIGFDILKRQGIARSLVLLPGHTVLTATFDRREVIVDPEFGVVIPHSLRAVTANPQLVARSYGALDPADTPLKYEPGTALVNLDFVGPQEREGQRPKRFTRDDVARFMVDVFSDAPRARFHNTPTDSRMVVFEPISYVLKWLLPALPLLLWLVWHGRQRIRRRSLA